MAKLSFKLSAMKFITRKDIRYFFYWLLASAGVLFLVGLMMLYQEGGSFYESLRILSLGFLQIGPWILLSIPFLVFLILRYLWNSYHTDGSKNFLKKLSLLILLPLGLIFSAFSKSQIGTLKRKIFNINGIMHTRIKQTL